MRVLIVFTLLMLSATLTAQQLAFPGAVGFGRFATGGRNGTVYRVTNLNDSGAGSLRDAISQPNRIVVFDVAGVINISSRLVFSSNLTIAGQTAPGEGITIYGNGSSFSGANNVIVQHLRFRMGTKGDTDKDAIGIANGHTMIFDHVSVSWGRDETFSISWDGKGTEPGDITIQNSIIGQGLQSHSAGGLIQTDGGITLFRNLYIDNKTRNPKVKGLNQYVNNVVYNWGNGGCYILGDSEGTSWATIVNNYFIKGPSSTGSAYSRANNNFQLYATGNYVDYDADGVLNGTLSQQADYGPVFWVESPEYWATVPVGSSLRIPKFHPEIPNVQSAEEAYHYIKNHVGASVPARDLVDAYMIDELVSLGTKGELINSQEDLRTRGPGLVYSAPKAVDSDNDGMPDWWEETNGTNKNLNDAMVIGADGYANIEKYIHSITQGQPFLKYPIGIIVVRKSTSDVELNFVNEETNATELIVEMKPVGGSYAEVKRIAGSATSVVVDGLAENMIYYFRFKAVNETMESSYSSELAVSTNASATPPLPSESPNPANGTTITQYKNITLSWNNTTSIMGGLLYYDVWFGPSEEEMEMVATGITAKTFTTGVLQEGTTYYWQIVTTNLLGVDEGPVWSFTTGQAIQRNKLVHFPFNESTGTTAVDFVSQTEATAYNFSPLWQAGKFSNSLYSSASPTNSHLKFAHNSNLFLDAKSFTISVWFKSPGGIADSYLLHKGTHDKNNGGTGKWFGIQYKGTTLTFAVDDDITKTNIDITGANTYFNDQWHHLACVRDVESDKLLVYIDGVKRGEKTDGTNTGIGESGDLVIGNRNNYFDNPFKGSIDELIIFEGALAATEIYDLFAEQVTRIGFSMANQNIKVYPNPFSNKLEIELPDANKTDVFVTITNLAGAVVKNQKVFVGSNNRVVVTGLDGLPIGIYQVYVHQGNGRFVAKVIKH